MNRQRRTFLGLTALAWVPGALSGCEREPAPSLPEYAVRPAADSGRVFRFGVHLGHHPQKLDQAFSPLMAYLSRRIPGSRFELEGASSFPHFEAKLRERQLDFAMPNPYQAFLALDWGYRVIAQAGDSEDFRGVFIIRKDSGIRVPADLKGKAVAYPATTALAAGMMPRLWLAKQGLDVNRDIENRYVGSQESAILNAYLGESAAGATWPPPWRAFQKAHPEEASQLLAIWETPPLINNAVVARQDLPEDLVAAVRDLLTRLHEYPDGQRVLAAMETSRIRAAVNADYEVVRRFIAEYETRVGPRP
ncbi:MAG: phosphonate transport system substrate-binding protein [bacterium]|nr:MAG: phosphonate transport system substrate-binding protein [bacterium]KAF0147979.1 MAG: phosphonate transport system substrate-binding protein [bacterium]KAF0167517.1 MAG: phosphonate transport system substrate-binding protein [bacterium]TXT17250.1 MAG: phosphonate transport system substrate-binding protein [bacterium]